jgi:hypothetical protein
MLLDGIVSELNLNHTDQKGRCGRLIISENKLSGNPIQIEMNIVNLYMMGGLLLVVIKWAMVELTTMSRLNIPHVHQQNTVFDQGNSQQGRCGKFHHRPFDLPRFDLS